MVTLMGPAMAKEAGGPGVGLQTPEAPQIACPHFHVSCWTPASGWVDGQAQ